MKRTILIALACAAAFSLAACDTLHSAGIGGEPTLFCRARDGTGHLEDKVAGPDSARVAVNRRFRDGDLTCHLLLRATLQEGEAAAAAARASPQ